MEAVRCFLPPALVLLLTCGCYAAGDILGDDDDSFPSTDDDDGADDDDDASVDDDDATPPPDNDGDGHGEDVDCDDDDPAVHPDATEVCNGLDDDCSGAADDGISQDWYLDADGDEWGDEDDAEWACEPLAGRVGNSGDCDDSDPAIHPGSAQQLDGVDSNCDGASDWLLQVWISGDDDFEWCLDDEDAMVPGDFGWPTGQHYEAWVTSGQHVIGIRGWDTGQVITAVIGHFTLSDGSLWITDASWKFDPNPAAGDDTRGGWCAVGFDDSAWQNANVIGPIGTSPWGNAPSSFPAGSPANWIWDYFPVDLNTQYLRLQIEVP